MSRFSLNLDLLGACASALCMVHCLAFPLLLAALPIWQISVESLGATLTSIGSNEAVASQSTHPTGEGCPLAVAGASSSGIETTTPACCSTPLDYWIHVGMLATVAPMGIVAWGAGFVQHRKFVVLGLGFVGVALLCSALLLGHNLFQGRGEPILTVAGSICMVSAHLWNRRQCRCCRHVQILETSPSAA